MHQLWSICSVENVNLHENELKFRLHTKKLRAQGKLPEIQDYPTILFRNFSVFFSLCVANIIERFFSDFQLINFINWFYCLISRRWAIFLVFQEFMDFFKKNGSPCEDPAYRIRITRFFFSYVCIWTHLVVPKSFQSQKPPTCIDLCLRDKLSLSFFFLSCSSLIHWRRLQRRQRQNPKTKYLKVPRS